jgi:two-component system CheB/CheR fusion protein
MPTSTAISTPEDLGRLLSALADQALEYAVILMDPDGRIVWWSAGAEQIFDLPSGTAIGQHSRMIFTPEDIESGIADLERRIARHEASAQDDRWHVRADGSRFWSSGALVALRDPDGELIGFGKLLRNRTKLKEQIERMREEARAARESEENQKVGIATLSHELRNVLAAFVHGLKLLRSQGASAARRTELLDMLEHQTSLVHRLTDDLLDISRLASGKLHLRPVDLEMQDSLRRAVANATERAKAKGLRLDLLMPPAPIVLQADPARLQQVFGNLLDNAIKYTPEGGRVWVKLTTEDPEAVVHVQDDGVGIPPDMLEQIFDLFTQVDTEAARHGLGIGLSLVKSLIELHGGSVQARSDGEGKGSEFTVRLPLQAQARREG